MPIDQYTREHVLISRVVDAFEAYTQAMNDGPEPERLDLARFLDFFREFGDIRHHEKEESLLIPAMVRGGCSWSDGPVERVRLQHQHERYLMRTLRHAALQKAPWSNEERRRLVATALSYVEFMRGHVRLEEGELLPLARDCIGGEELNQLAVMTRKFDDEWNQGGESEFLETTANELHARYVGAGGSQQPPPAP